MKQIKPAFIKFLLLAGIFSTVLIAPVTADAYKILASVVNEKGAFIPGVTFKVNNVAATATVDANKNYVISGKTAGTYTVTPSKTGWNFVQFNQPVTLPTSGQPYSPDGKVSFTGYGIYSISGQIYRSMSDGRVRGIRNITLSISGSTTQEVTDTDGNYSFTNLPAGSYIITPGSSDYTIALSPKTVKVPTVGLTSSPNAVANFRGTAKYRISGKVTNSAGAGISGVKVICSGSDSTGGADGPDVTATTDAAGAYLCNSLPSGIYSVLPVATAYSFTTGAKSISLPTTGTAAAPNGRASFTGAPAANAKTILPLSFYHVRDSDGTTPAAGVDVILFFEPNGVAVLYLAYQDDAIAFRGTYTYSSTNQLHLKFTDPQFTIDKTFSLNPAATTVTMPFKVFSSGSGTSTWDLKHANLVHNLSLIFKAASVNEDLYYDEAMARVLAYANAVIQIDNAPAPERSAEPAAAAAKLKNVKKLRNGVKLIYDSGPEHDVILFGWSNSDGQALTTSALASDPRLNLDVIPAETAFDPTNKTALLISPFAGRNSLAWYDTTFKYRNADTRSSRIAHFAMSGDDDITGMTALLEGRKYTVTHLKDDTVTVGRLITELRKSPGFIYYSSHGMEEGTLSTGHYLGDDSSDSMDTIINRFQTAYANLVKNTVYEGILNYKPTSTGGLTTMTIVHIARHMLGRSMGTSAFIGVTPVFWEALRVQGGANFPDSLVYISACETDKGDYRPEDPAKPGLALRDAVKAKAYFGYTSEVPSEFAGAVFQYFVRHLSRRTHAAEEAYYNIQRIAGAKQMIYTEDKLLDGKLPVLQAKKDASGKPLSLSVKDIFRGYGYSNLGTKDKVLPYIGNGWLTPDNPKFAPGSVWWMLFAGRWGQDAKGGSTALKNCYSDFWSKGTTGGLASPFCQNANPGYPPYTPEIGYSTYLLAGSPIFKTVKMMPRWTLNEAQIP